MNRLQQWNSRGKLVLEFDLRGCMAEEHVLKNVWEIIEFGDQRKFIPGSQSIHMARCRKIQSREDLPENIKLIPSDDLYPLPTGAFGQAMGYAWRH
jgi:hypothetical protein